LTNAQLHHKPVTTHTHTHTLLPLSRSPFYAGTLLVGAALLSICALPPFSVDITKKKKRKKHLFTKKKMKIKKNSAHQNPSRPVSPIRRTRERRETKQKK
jgi:hypothetical protein